MTRLAILTDIHANLPVLQAVMADMQVVALGATDATLSALRINRLRWRATIMNMRDDDLHSILRYQFDPTIVRERIRWHCLYHVVNHGMQHRSEAAHLLTAYGQSPGDIDFSLFSLGR